jgi:hypothetical protein
MDEEFPLPMFKDKYVRGYSTAFLRLTEAPISEGGIWLNHGVDWTDISMQPGLAFGTQAGGNTFDDSVQYLARTWGPNQKSSIVIHKAGTIGASNLEVECHVRGFTDGAHVQRGYELNIAFNAAYATIVRWNGALGDFTNITQLLSGVPTPNDGDVLSLEIVGSSLVGRLNGSSFITGTDTTWTNGSPGMGFFRVGGTAADQQRFCAASFNAITL